MRTLQEQKSEITIFHLVERRCLAITAVSVSGGI
jgi:hypothetical protein